MSGEHEQESGDNLPLVYAALAENRRILLAHEAEQDAIEAAEPDLEYACPPQWVGDPPPDVACSSCGWRGRSWGGPCPACRMGTLWVRGRTDTIDQRAAGGSRGPGNPGESKDPVPLVDGGF